MNYVLANNMNYMSHVRKCDSTINLSMCKLATSSGWSLARPSQVTHLMKLKGCINGDQPMWHSLVLLYISIDKGDNSRFMDNFNVKKVTK